VDSNAHKFDRQNMPIKFYFFILCTVLLSGPLEAKEIGSPCFEGNKLCSSFSEALKDKPNHVPLKFERIVDGDTFVAGHRVIRIWGIDAPEKNDPAYRISGWLLQSLIKDKTLDCRLISKDKYKRDVMQCHTEDIDIGSVMVKFGMAKDYKRYSAGYYRTEEIEAKSKKRGIWGEQQSKKNMSKDK